MVVEVHFRIGQALSHRLGGLSLAPGSMLLRLRRASIALLGLIGVVGLGLVVFISQLGWPGVLNSPLPGTTARSGSIDDGVALARTPSVLRARPALSGRNGVALSARRGGKEGHARRTGASNLGDSHQLAGTPAGQPSPSPAAPPPSPEPPAGDTTTVPVSVPASPATAAAGGPSAPGAAKATRDGRGASSPSTSKAKATATKGSSPSSSKASEAAAAKSHRDESAATQAPLPATAAGGAGSPPAASPAAAKEAADAANSGH